MSNLKSVVPCVAALTMLACATEPQPQAMQVDLHAMQAHAARVQAVFDQIMMRVHAANLTAPITVTADGNATSISAPVPAGPARTVEVSAWDTTVTPNQVYYWGETTLDLRINQILSVDLDIYPAGLLTGTAYVGGAVGPQVSVNVQAVSTNPNGASVELLLDGNNVFVQPLPVGTYTLKGVATVGGQVMLLDQPGVFTINQGQTVTIRPHFVGPGSTCTTPIDNDGDGYLCTTDPNNPSAIQDCDDNNANAWKSCSTCEDKDGDHWYVGCDTYDTVFGPDCNDNDPYNWISCATCNDTDGDGWRNAQCDAYDPNTPTADCDDNDTNNWISCNTCLDVDRDNVFSGCDRYISDPGPDCNPNNGSVWVSCITCQDLDGDGYFSGCDSYTNNPNVKFDCNDADPLNWASCFTCADRDGDGYFTQCDSYSLLQPEDCDDSTTACTAADANCQACINGAYSMGLAAGDGTVTVTWNILAAANAVAYNVYVGADANVSNAVGTYNQALYNALPPLVLRGLPNNVPVWVSITASNGYSETPLGSGAMEATPQPLFGNIVAVGAGINHSVALKADGTVWTWGDNSQGQTGTGHPSPVPRPVPGLPPIAEIAVGSFHTLALDANGAIWAWGANQNNQCGQVGMSIVPTPMPINSAITHWRAISAGDRHSLAISGPTAYAWGDNTFNQLGTAAIGSVASPQPVSTGATMVAVAAGYRHSLALDMNNVLYTWGTSSTGALGTAVSNVSSPKPVAGIYSAVAAGDDHSFVTAGSAPFFASVGVNPYVFGTNVYFQDQNSVATFTATLPVGLAFGPAQAVFVATRNHCVAIDNAGSLWTWGHNDAGQVGVPAGTDQYSPTLAFFKGAGAPAIAAAVGGHHTLALLADGSVWAWGDNTFGQLGTGPLGIPNATPTRLGVIKSVTAGDTFSAMLRSDGKALVWGDATHGQMASQAPMALTPFPSVVSLPTPLIALVAGSTHLVALDVTGQVYTWGDNTFGEAGINSALPVTPPTPVPGIANVRFVAAGSHFSVASDGNVTWAWGRNNVGQLGAGNTVDAGAPVVVLANCQSHGGMASLSAGYQHVLAGCRDGSVYAWGSNANNQLGPTTFPISSAPLLVTPAPWSGVAQVSAGNAHSMVLDAAGNLYAWGDNSFDQMLTDTVLAQSGNAMLGSYPMTLIAAGNDMSLGMVGSDQNNVWGAGINTSGQVGQGFLSGDVNVLTQITAGGFSLYPTALAAPSHGAHALATASFGTQVFAWGSNTNGQVGSNAVGGNVISPTPVALTHTFLDVRAGARFAVALRDDGTVYTWGANDAGQLGIGYLAAFACGSQLHASTGSLCALGSKVSTAPAQQIAVGTNHALVLDTNNNLWGWGDNNMGEILTPSTPDGLTDKPTIIGTGFFSIAAGDGFSVGSALTGGNYQVYTWGAGGRGQMGNGGNGNAYNYLQTPSVALSPSPIPVFAGGCTAYAATSSGMYAWGCNDLGQTGTGVKGADVLVPTPMVGIGIVSALCAGDDYGLALDNLGRVLGWGNDAQGQLGDGGAAGTHVSPTIIGNLPPIVDIACGSQFAVAVDARGKVWAWGTDATGQLGPGGQPNALPAPIPGLFALSHGNPPGGMARHIIAAGGSLAVAPQTGFTVVNTASGFVAFGANEAGQLGQSSANAGTAKPGYVQGI